MTENIRFYSLRVRWSDVSRDNVFRFGPNHLAIAKAQFDLRCGYPGVEGCDLVAEHINGESRFIERWPRGLSEMAGKV